MEQQKISLSGPPELLAVLPYHLGFRPARSVVVVSLHDKRMGLVVRLDADPSRARATKEARSLVAVLRRERATGVMVIDYEDEADECRRLSDAIVKELPAARITLVDRIVVHGERWTGLMCTCCPDEPVPEPHEVGAVASYVALGRAALDSREDLVRTVRPAEPAPADLTEAIDAWIATVLDPGRFLAPAPGPRPAGEHLTQAELCVRAWGDLISGRLDAIDITGERLCLLLGSLRHRGLRDGIIAMLCPGSLSRDALDPLLVDLLDEYVAPAIDSDDSDGDHQGGRVGDAGWGDERGMVIGSRLERLCRLAPDSHAAPVLAVTGARAWFAGEGAAARIAVERALEVEPGHVLARLLGHLLETGVRPPGLAA